MTLVFKAVIVVLWSAVCCVGGDWCFGEPSVAVFIVTLKLLVSQDYSLISCINYSNNPDGTFCGIILLHSLRPKMCQPLGHWRRIVPVVWYVGFQGSSFTWHLYLLFYCSVLLSIYWSVIGLFCCEGYYACKVSICFNVWFADITHLWLLILMPHLNIQWDNHGIYSCISVMKPQKK